MIVRLGLVMALALALMWPIASRADAPAPSAPLSGLAEACRALRARGQRNPGAAPTIESQWPPSSPRGSALEARLAACVGAPSSNVPRTLRMHVDGRFLVVAFQTGRRFSWLRRFLGLVPSPARVRVRLDAELRSYVAERPALRRAAVVARSMPLPSHGYTAIAAHRGGVVLVSSDEVTSLRYGVRRGRPRLSLEEAMDIAPVVGNPRDVLSRAESGALYWLRGASLRQLRRRPLRHDAVRSPCEEGAFPFEDACAHWALGRDYFDSRLATRLQPIGRTAMPPPQRAPTSFYARVRQMVRRRDGTIDAVEVVVSPRGRMVARTGARNVGVAGYGAALAGADVDQDGSLEVFASLDSPLGEGDRMHIIRVRPDGSLLRIWMSEPVEGSILHATAGDVDGDGFDEFLAVEETRDGAGNPEAKLWIVR